MKMIDKRISVLLFMVLAFSVHGYIADSFQVIGNEMETAVDAVTGRSFVYLTSGDYMNCHNYPHNRSWLENGTYVLVESSRPRPDGTYNARAGSEDIWFRGERQLLAVDIETGNIYYLDTLEMEDPKQYPGHLSISSQYHADYSPVTNTLIYSDMTGHKLYLLDLNTGKKNCIWHLKNGTFDNVPAMSRDGKTAIVWTAFPGPAGTEFLYGRTSIAYKFEIDGVELKETPAIIYTFANIVDPKDGRSIAPCHPDINPVDPSIWDFCHGFRAASDGSVLKTRTWWGKTDGSMISIATVTPQDRVFTHEIWGPKGRYIYWVNIPDGEKTGGVSRVDPRTQNPEVVFEGLLPRCLHITLSGDENLIAYDTQSYLDDNPLDKHNNHDEWIAVYNMNTKKHTNLLRVREGRDHPRQNHPAINEEGTKIAFTTADKYNSRVAIVEIHNID